MKPVYDVIVIGAGAAGLTAAISAAETGASVAVLEKAEKAGRKILASGNGRCNMMNRGQLRYFGDAGFAGQVLSFCSAEDLACFFRDYGLLTCEEEDGRVYPFSLHSSTVLTILANSLRTEGAEMFLRSGATSVWHEYNQFRVLTESGFEFHCRKLIIACGGKAQPRLGGSEDGYAFLCSLGHTKSGCIPSLVPLVTDKRSISGLSGIRVRCGVNLFNDGVSVHREHGEVLFTDYGISGICVMQCSRFVRQSGSIIELNLAGDAFRDDSALYSELRRRYCQFSRFSPVCLLEGFLVSRLSYAVLKQAGIPLSGELVSDLSDEQLKRIATKAFHYQIPVLGTRGMDYAQVTAGGIICSDFSAETMESRIIPGLYAAGEVLDVDGDCGGFNLMFAFASGRIAGMSAGRSSSASGRRIKT